MAQRNPHFGAHWQNEKEGLAERPTWTEFRLFSGGHELKYCAAFPKTCATLRQLPEGTKFGGDIKFSTMAPGTVVKPHFALSNDHIRIHLGLDVPEPHAQAARRLPGAGGARA